MRLSYSGAKMQQRSFVNGDADVRAREGDVCPADGADSGDVAAYFDAAHFGRACCVKGAVLRMFFGSRGVLI